MSDRLAQIEARRIDASYESETAGFPKNIQALIEDDTPWLIARVRELEAQAASGQREMNGLRVVCEGLRKVCGIAVREADVLRERVAELEAHV